MDYKFFIVTIILFTIFILELFLNKNFISLSSELTVEMQKLNENFKYYFWIFSFIFYKFIIFFGFLSIYLFKSKIKGILFFGFILINISINNFIKSAYHLSRPMFWNKFIKIYFKCSCSYGYLSGHCYESSFFYYILLNEFIIPNINNKIVIKFFKILIYFIIINIGLSRIYFGNHSLDQVIAGYFLGIFFISIYYKFNKYLKYMLKKIIYLKCFKTLIFLFIFLILLFFMNLTVVILNIYYRNTKQLNKSKLCNKCFIDKNKIDFNSFKTITSIFVLIGLVIGNYLNLKIKNYNYNKIVYFSLILLNYSLLILVYFINIKNIFINIIFKMFIYFFWGFNSGYLINKIVKKNNY